MENDISKISNFLEKAPKPILDEYACAVVKAKVMKIARKDEKMIGFMRSAAGVATLSVGAKAMLKERIMNEIANQKRSIFDGVAVMFRKAVSAFLVFAMCIGLFGFLNISTHIAMAGSFTSIENFRGDVFVERGGERMVASDDMRLYEGDSVYTLNNGWVSIKFLDDSVSRLKEDSGVLIKKLFRSDENSSVTNVEVEVEMGDVWSRVLNLFEDGSDFSVKAGDIQASAKKAAFNVHKEGQEASVEVYSNVVNLKSSSEEKKVVSGQKAIKGVAAASEVTRMPSDAAKNSWVQSNLESDVAHIAKVEESRGEALKDAVGALPGSAFYSVKSLRNDVNKLLTFDDVSDAKLDFETAERKFVEWTVLLKDGKATDAEVKSVFDKFITESEKFKGVIAGVRASGDDKYADELKNYLKNKLSERKKDLSTVLPDSPMYAAKGVVFEAEIASAETDTEKTLIMQVQASLKLSEAQDLKQAGEEELSKAAVESYVKASEQIKEEVKALTEEGKVEVASAVKEALEDGEDALSVFDDLPVAGEMGGASVSEVEVVKPAHVYNPVPAQKVIEFGVPVAGSGDDEKPLDPSFNLGR